MKVETTRFKIKKGKAHRIDEWMEILNKRKDECIQTLHREKMFVEAIFRESINGEDFLTWFSIQGKNGSDVKTSEHEIDKIHLEFWNECIDSNYRPFEKKPEAIFIHPEIYEKIKEIDKIEKRSFKGFLKKYSD